MPTLQKGGRELVNSQIRPRRPRLPVDRWIGRSILWRRRTQTRCQIRREHSSGERPFWHQAATWNDSVSSDATWRTSDRTSGDKTWLYALLMSSRVIPFARHSRIRETEIRVPRIAKDRKSTRLN